MKEWIVSVIIAVFSFSAIELILPESKLNKFIKRIFAILMIFVVVEPVLKLKNNEIDLSETFINGEVSVQADYMEYINSKQLEYYENNCEQIVNSLGVSGAQIELIYIIDEDYEIVVEKVVVNLQNSVINSDKEHIDIIEGLKTTISEYLNVDKDSVCVYE